MTAPISTAEPWNGVPDSPEQEGVHYVGDEVWLWTELGRWHNGGWRTTWGDPRSRQEAARCTYGGPIPAPAELAALRAENAALRRVADAARAWRSLIGVAAPDGTGYRTMAELKRAIDALDATPGQQVRE